MSFSTLPNELVLIIAEALDSKDTNSLLRTCKWLHCLLDRHLYRLAVRKSNSDSLFWFLACTPRAGECHAWRMHTVSKCIAAGVDVDMAWEADEDHKAYWPGQCRFGQLLRPMGMAAVMGDVRLAELLLDAGADINLAGYSGLPPISVAILAHEPDMVDFLLANETNLDCNPRTKEGPLKQAASRPRFLDLGYWYCGGCHDRPRCRHIFKAVLAAMDNVGESSLDGGDAALFEAVVAGNDSDVQALMATGKVNPNEWTSREEESQTALMYACSRGRLSTVQLLCEPSTTDVNYVGGWPVHCAANHGHWDVVYYLLRLDRVNVHAWYEGWDQWFASVCKKNAATKNDPLGWIPIRKRAAREMIQRVDMTEERAEAWTRIANDGGLRGLAKPIQASFKKRKLAH